MENLTTIKLREREIPLYCSTLEMETIEEEIGCTLGQLRDEVFGLKLKDPEADPDKPESWVFGLYSDPEKKKKFGKLLRILGNAGLEENGQEPDLTDRWVLRGIKPGMLLMYALVALSVTNDAQRMETVTQKPDDGTPVDEFVEEENRKKALEK